MHYKADYRHPGYARISQHYYRELISRNPILGTLTGAHQFDGLLPETGAEARERNIFFLRELRNDFSALPENELSIDEKIDRESIIQFANQQLFWEEDLQRWKFGQDLATSIGEAIFLLFSRDFAPLSDRVLSMISRLKAVRPYLMCSKNLFQRVPALFGEIYLDSANRLPHFLDSVSASLNGMISPILLAEFDKASLEAKKALDEFASWLKHAILPRAETDWALGPSAFQAMLGVKKLGINQAEAMEIAQQIFQESTERLENLSCLILGVATGATTGARAEVQKRINHHSPASFSQVVSSYREALSRSRAFVELHGFATLPESEELEIIETPSFLAHLIPISAYIGPEKTAKQQKGIYLLTRERDDSAGRHNYADIINSVIHQGYPGHHLQIAAQNQHPGIMRSFCDNLELIEGWARYCQRRIREIGFESSDESYFAHATADVFDSSRMIAEIQLQTRNWSIDQAVTFLSEKNHLPRAFANAEIRRHLMTPGQQISGIVGEHAIHRLKENMQHRFKGDFSDKIFHDLILYQGGIPLHVAHQFYPEMMQNQIKSRNRF